MELEEARRQVAAESAKVAAQQAEQQHLQQQIEARKLQLTELEGQAQVPSPCMRTQKKFLTQIITLILLFRCLRDPCSIRPLSICT